MQALHVQSGTWSPKATTGNGTLPPQRGAKAWETPRGSVSSAAGGSITQQQYHDLLYLKELNKLRKQGIITDLEFEAKKNQIIWGTNVAT